MTDEDQLAEIKLMMDEVAKRLGDLPYRFDPENITGKYILRGHEPVACPDLILWALWFEDHANRIVQQDQIGDYWVSTIFLGLDHGFNFTGGPRVPILFETMTLIGKPGKDEDGERRGIWSDGCQRYSTWDQALAGHLKICERLRNSG
jgi:hypothetical protein